MPALSATITKITLTSSPAPDDSRAPTRLRHRRGGLIGPLLGALLAALLGCGGGGGGGGGGSSNQPAAGPDTTTLPLMNRTRALGVIYSDTDPTAKPTLDMAFGETLSSGADSYQLAVTWASLESSPGVIDLSSLQTLLDTVQSAGLTPYLALKTIDTVPLAVPSDLIDPNDSTSFTTGRHFDDADILDRFATLLDALVPLLVSKGGFFLSVGNEIDPWLANHPAERTPFLNFVAAARARVRSIDPRLAVSATMTYEVFQTDPSLFDEIRDLSDAVAMNYYPLGGGMVRSPTVVATELSAVVTRCGDRPLLIQEAGYPSGALNGSSETMQRDFVEALFTFAANEPKVRFLSLLHLSDHTASSLQVFQAYYGSSDPQFVEFLATLGVREADGTAKPAYSALLAGLQAANTP